MKILKIFGAVVGIHVFALLFIFANPGCSSTTKPTPAPSDTIAKADASPAITVPMGSAPVTVPTGQSPISAVPLNFNPDAPATAAPPVMSSRYSPTRPNTAAASTLVAEPVTNVQPATTYTVKAGDSLWSIASKNHTSYAELAAANSLKTNTVLHAGQKLVIPGKMPAPAAAPAPTKGAAMNGAAAKSATEPAAAKAAATGGEQVKYTVKSGETLSSIAKTLGVKQGDLAVANNITDPQKLRAGMVLVVPGGGWQVPGAKNAGKNAAKSTGKAAAEPVAPAFTTPTLSPNDPDSPIKAAPAPAGTPGDIPITKVEDVPAPKKP